VLSALLLVATAIAARADPSQYLCTAERSTELHYDRQARAWAPWAFVTDDKFILRRLNDDDRNNWAKHSDAQWGFFKSGEALPTALCGFDLRCFWGAVEFDKDLSWRWYKDSPNNPDDWLIEAGKCSAF
jgi:hypothetical protein